MKTDTLETFRQIISADDEERDENESKGERWTNFENNDGAERKRVAESEYVSCNCWSIGTEALRSLLQELGS